MAPPWNLSPSGVILQIHLQPRAKHNQLVGLHGNALKVTLTAPPVDGAANAALVSFLSKLLDVPRAAITILAGAKSRHKRILVEFADSQAILQRLEHLLSRLDKTEMDD